MSEPEPLAAVLEVPALLSIPNAARLLDCSPRTVRRRIEAGLIPAVLESGRLMIRADELHAYIIGLTRHGNTRAATRRHTPRVRRFEFLHEHPGHP